jgi:hypothetical protein
MCLVAWCVVCDVDHHTPSPQKELGTFPEDGNVMPKHVGATIHN